MNGKCLSTMIRLLTVVWVSFLFSATAGSLTAQTIIHIPLYTFHGDQFGDRFGRSVSDAGDVNEDGTPDLIVGSVFDSNGGFSGSARVISGSDGSILYRFDGERLDNGFGGCVSGAGDVNGDGTPDLIVGAPSAFDGGYARVLSGSDGSVLYNFNGNNVGDSFGKVSGAGDVNGDGFDDVIVGSARDRVNEAGYTRVLSGSDGSVLYNFNGDNEGDLFGGSVSGAGDVNGDGTPDLIVGAYQSENNGFLSGSARVFSGSDGSVLYNFNGDSARDQFGVSVSGAGDVNGDGFADLIVGSLSISGIGYARVFSGSDGSVLYNFNGDGASDFFGGSVSGAGDLNGDGFDDFIVGAGNTGGDNHGGYARVFVSQIAELGDCNHDGVVNFLDIDPFISILSSGDYLAEADIDQNGVVDFLDIQPFIALLSS